MRDVTIVNKELLEIARDGKLPICRPLDNGFYFFPGAGIVKEDFLVSFLKRYEEIENYEALQIW